MVKVGLWHGYFCNNISKSNNYMVDKFISAHNKLLLFFTSFIYLKNIDSKFFFL